MRLLMLIAAIAGATFLMIGAQTDDPKKRKNRFAIGTGLLAVTLGLLLSL